jgi:phosphonate transport system permease protein
MTPVLLPDAQVAAFESRRRRILLRGRLEAIGILLVLSFLLLCALHASEFVSGDYGEAPLGRLASFLARMDPHLQPANLFAPSDTEGSLAYWFYGVPVWARALLTSMEMATVASVWGALLAMIAATLMARTLMPNVAVRQIVRRTLDVARTLPDFILAMLLVQAIGTGPMAGVTALTITTFASLARPFAEAAENADLRAMDSIRAAGGGWLAQIRYGLVPLIAPNIVSLAFITFEFNVSRSAGLGIVGAGGIGQQLAAALAYNQFSTYLAIVLMTVGLVVLTDLGSEHLRHRLFGSSGER